MIIRTLLIYVSEVKHFRLLNIKVPLKNVRWKKRNFHLFAINFLLYLSMRKQKRENNHKHFNPLITDSLKFINNWLIILKMGIFSIFINWFRNLLKFEADLIKFMCIKFVAHSLNPHNFCRFWYVYVNTDYEKKKNFPSKKDNPLINIRWSEACCASKTSRITPVRVCLEYEHDSHINLLA